MAGKKFENTTTIIHFYRNINVYFSFCCFNNDNDNDKICNAHISTLLGAQGANPETPGQAPTLSQHTGPTASRPIRRTKQLWLSVLLKNTSAATGQAGIRTHILGTPELESNALDRSATMLHFVIYICNLHMFILGLILKLSYILFYFYFKGTISSRSTGQGI